MTDRTCYNCRYYTAITERWFTEVRCWHSGGVVYMAKHACPLWRQHEGDPQDRKGITRAEFADMKRGRLL